MQPERWLESLLRADLTTLDAHLQPRPVYVQVPAIAGAGDRGMLDLLAVTAEHRLAVIEVKADEDLHFAMQGLDYWIRIHPATETVLRHLDARVRWTLIALDERWRTRIRPVWRKQSGNAHAPS